MEAAISIGTYFGVETHDIKNAIESFKPDNKRSQWIDKVYCKIILDAYNANPTSMQAAIENFSKNETIDKIVILGDMFELGETSMEEHQNMMNLVENARFGKTIFIGERFNQTNSSSAVKYSSFEDFKKDFLKSDFTGKTILIKGSRGMALERVLELF
jgi:UDP-N-acetylmuramoyl-tripeptide--D-alanyl-D-alanine ligase